MRLFGREVSLTRRSAGGLSPVAENRGGWWPIIRESFTGAWQRNMEWSADTVAAHHAVYACITRISQDIGKLRPKLVEQDNSTKIWAETENTAHSPLLRRPNRYQNHIQFKEWWATSKLFRGNTYVWIERDQRGVPAALHVLDPNRVQVLVSPDGAVFYRLQTDNLSGLEQDIEVPASEIIHDRMNCLYHPLVGTSPIFACGAAANMGLQIQNNSSSFFGNGSNPSGILSTATPITPAQATEMSDQWAARFGPGAPGGVAVLGFGMKFEAMRMSATDSQTIEQLHWTAETVCSTFHVPPWKIGIGEQPAYTKPEIANQVYYSDCLQSHIEQWELCMDRAFGFDETKTGERWLGIELDLDGLLRMDAAGYYDAMVKASGGAVLTPDEARKKLDQPPLPGGATLYRQQQEFSLAALAERDQNEPFSKPDTPALPAPEPQKQLTAGANADASAERMARLAALIDINAARLRVAA